MIDLSEWEEAVNKALEDGNPCLLVSADKEGHPDVAIKGSMMIFDNEHFAWWERSLAEQIEQVAENPHVAVFYRSIERRIVLRIYGEATLHKDGPMKEAIHAKVVEPEKQKDPEMKGFAVSVRVDRVRVGSNTVQERD